MASIKISQHKDSNDIFILMHKNIEVCQIEFEGKGKVKNVNVFVGSEAHMPIGSSKDIHSFREWWSNRAIPKTRNNVKTALEKLGFDNYVEYRLTELSLSNRKKGIGCSSYNFCNEHSEAISLSSVYNLKKKKNHESNFEHLRNTCIKIGINPKEYDDYFDYLILSDFLLTNTDRHLNNISVLRDPDTLKVKGFSPIYDTGNSMCYKMSMDEINELDIYNISISSIEDKEVKMLKHVKNRNIIVLSKLDLDFSIYDNDIKENEPRKQLYIDLFNRKKELLISFQKRV